MPGIKKNNAPIIPYIVLAAIAIISVFPFVWTFIGTTHTNTEVFKIDMAFIPGSNIFENYKGLMGFSNIWRNLGNSIFISLMTTVIVLAIDSMAGYAFGKFNFKGKNLLFFICLMTMFIPFQVTQVPLFIQMGNMGLAGSRWAVILPTGAAMFGVFLMKQNLETYPDEILEAGRIDGAGEFRTFLQLVMPTMRPALASLGIVTFVNQWGNYLWPLIILKDRESSPLPLILAMMVAPGQVVNYGSILLGASISILPVLIFFLIFQKQFISGMLGGAVKG
ncbi:MAG: carbohydrate ABC transporter permease [Clostridiaceae bacterium]|nr:carbohydrate ABC transporter permease [Clostridiaceae bacterium]